MIRIICSLFLIFICSSSAFTQYISTVNGNVMFSPIDQKRNVEIRKVIDDNKFFLASFSAIPNEAASLYLNTAGYEIISFVPPSSYICRKSKQHTKLEPLVNSFTAVRAIPAELKLSTTLFNRWKSGQAISGTFLISTFRKEDQETLKTMLDQLQLSYQRDKWTTGTDLIVRIDNRDQFDLIVNQSTVSNLSTYHGPPQPETNSNSMFSNQIFHVNYDRIGPTGNGTYFSNIEHYGRNAEFRINTKGRNHSEFGVHYPDNTETLSHSHGSQVSMYAASTGNVNEYEDRGMAEGATLIQMPAYDSIETYYVNHELSPLTLNVSAGIGTSTVDYNNAAKEFDRITRTLKGFLVCFSAGNDGHSTNPHLNYGPGWANISSDDKTTKNNFTVHAAAQPGEHFDWACNGPTTDGRLKPDISAEGRFGTSFASPNLAGLINVLYESYQQSYNDIARSDVIKAVILNTAIDADKRGIDFKTGFGTVNPIGAHRAIQEKRIFTDVIQQGNDDSRQFEINIPDGLRQLKILLYWHDFEGTPGAAKALVNDLDLEVNAPSGDLYLPWTLDPTPGKQYDLPLRRKDDLNNVEQVTLTDPEPGVYNISVRGHFVPMGPQDFVITYEAIPYSIEITSPAKNFRTARNKTIMFTWNAALDTTVIDNEVEIILQQQTGNLSLLTTVPATQLYYNYTVPPGFPFTSTARVIVRQKNTGIADTSEFFQVMETPSSFRFTGACDDKVSFTWVGVPIVGTKYIVYRLGENYMEPISEVDYPATTLTIDADTILQDGVKFGKEDWFAIAALHPNGALSLRSTVISTQQTNLLNASTHIAKDYLLCFGDSVIVSALNLEGDSLRWVFNDQPLQGAEVASLIIRGSNPGNYSYRIYQENGCVFYSDTFHVSSPLAISDTLVYGPKIWNVFVFRNHDPNQYYGRMPMRPVSINSLNYYHEFGQIDDAVDYTGCAPGFIYTILYKRAGFTKGLYTFDLKQIQENMRLFINDELVYTSPSNMANLGVIWQGKLDEHSKVRIEHIVRGRALMNLDVQINDEEIPAGIENDLLIWLKGSDVLVNAENRVTHWLDSYVHSLQNAADTMSDARHVTGNLNYNDVLMFHGRGGIFGKFPALNFTNEVSTFAVFKMESGSDFNARVMGFGFPPYYLDDNYRATYSPFYRNGLTSQIGLMRDSMGLFPPGEQVNNWQLMSVNLRDNQHSVSLLGEEAASAPHDLGGFLYQTYSIGCRPDTSAVEGELLGSIAEILHFQRSLTPSEELRLHSYLALKYGFTLAQPYQNGFGQVIYNQEDFKSGIAGIAREDQSGWLQKQSKTNTPDLFIGSKGPLAISNSLNTIDIPKDSTYVVWGHNGQPAAFLIYVDDTTTQLLRTYKLQHTGEAGTFRFNFDDQSGLFENEDMKYSLVFSDDPIDFSSANSFPLDTYTADDGNAYHYAEVDLKGISTVYFSLQQTIDTTVTVSINDLSDEGVRLFPNPFTDHLAVEGTSTGDIIEIYDALGRKLLQKIATNNESEINYSFDPGYYLFIIRREGREVFRTIMVNTKV